MKGTTREMERPDGDAVDFEGVFNGPDAATLDNRVPPYRLIRSAIADGRKSDAIAIAGHFAERAQYAFELINRWCASILKYLADHGLTAEDIAGIEEDLRRLVAYPHGEPFEHEREWRQFQETRDRLLREIGTAPTEVALATAETLKESWRSIHDRNNDYISGLLNVVHVRFGEREIDAVYRDYIVGDFVDGKYSQFGQSPEAFAAAFDKLVDWTFAGIQLHMSGRERDGSIGFEDFEDRVEFTFDPCGNGSRMMLGEPRDGTPSRLGAPYFYRVIEGAYDFTWNRSGVCHYCVHCNLIQHKMPIEKFGYPMRVVEPPTHPDRTDAKCKWIIYRHPDLVPERCFHEVGEQKPVKASK